VTFVGGSKGVEGNVGAENIPDYSVKSAPSEKKNLSHSPVGPRCISMGGGTTRGRKILSEQNYTRLGGGLKNTNGGGDRCGACDYG